VLLLFDSLRLSGRIPVLGLRTVARGDPSWHCPDASLTIPT